MIANLSAELILMSMEYLSFQDAENLAWMMHIVKRDVPMALDRKLLMEYITISSEGREMFHGQ